MLEHSHRPLHLRKGDFYSYLSLSSHDSDCGEVSQCSEDKSSSPAPYSLPSYATPTQGLHSPSPELFTSTRRQRRSPSPDSRNDLRALDLRSAEREATGSEPASPSRSPPPSPDIRDEETLFAACTEEVYLGPPLCYSMVLTRKPRTPRLKENSPRNSPENLPSSNDRYLTPEGPHSDPGDVRSHLCPSEESVLDQTQTEETQRSFLPLPEPRYTSFSTSSFQGPGRQPGDDNPPSPPAVSSGAEEERQGEDSHLLCDVAGREVAAAASVSAPQEERSRNEGPAYLNPWARVGPIDSSAAECLEDTKTLESNMGTVMTKISVCGSATNPSKEPAATRINPKINCSPMREADRGEEGGRRGAPRRAKREEKTTRGRSGSQQEARTVAAKQVSVPRVILIRYIRTLYCTSPPHSRY